MKIAFLLSLSVLISCAHVSKEAERIPAAVQSLNPDRILYIGDSHTVGAFGHKLDELIRKETGKQLTTYGSAGSVVWWYRDQYPAKYGYFHRDMAGSIDSQIGTPTPDFSKVYSELLPQKVIVALSGNYFRYPEAFTRKDVRGLAKEIYESGSQCIWITAPDSRLYKEERKKTIAIIKEEVSPYCDVIESTKYTKYYTDPNLGDGIHYGPQAGGKWAQDLFEAELKSLLK